MRDFDSGECLGRSGASAFSAKDTRLAALAALFVTLVAYFLHFSIFLNPLAFLIFLVPLLTVLAPTFGIYFASFLACLYIWRTRSSRAGIIFLVTLIPFAHWGYSLYQVHLARIAEQRRIAAIPTAALPRIPSTLVVRTVYFPCQALKGRSVKFQRVITQAGAHWEDSSEQSCDTNSFSDYNGQPVPNWPSEYLLLQPLTDDKLIERGAMFDDGNSPLELRYVAPGHDDRIGISYAKIMRKPLSPPLLSLFGWIPGESVPTSEQNTGRHATFIVDSIDVALEKGRRHPSSMEAPELPPGAH